MIPIALSSAIASALVGLTASASLITPRRTVPQLTSTLVRPSESAVCSDVRATRTTVPSTTPLTPVPGSLAKSVTGASLRPRSRAAVTIAAATGCSEAASTAAPRASTTSASSPGAVSIALTFI